MAMVDPNSGYKYAKFKRSYFNGVQEKAKNFCFKQGNMSIISLEHTQKINDSGVFIIQNLLDITDNCTKFQFDQITILSFS